MEPVLLAITKFLAFSTYGQLTINGTISDGNASVPFANIVIKNSTKGVLADANGHFVIEVKPTDTLQISSLGYKTKEIVVGEQEQIDIILDEYEELDQVIVTGYTWHTRCKSTGCSVRVVCEYYEDTTEMRLHPNPSRDGIFKLEASEDYDHLNLVVADLTGRIVLNTSPKKQGSSILVDLSQQPSGVYIINLYADEKKIASKKAIRI